MTIGQPKFTSFPSEGSSSATTRQTMTAMKQRLNRLNRIFGGKLELFGGKFKVAEIFWRFDEVLSSTMPLYTFREAADERALGRENCVRV